MVLSNKKLKQKLRAMFEEIVDSKKPANLEPETPKSFKQLLDSTTQKPRLSKREKRRENISSLPSNGENNDTQVDENSRVKKKRKREKKGVGNGENIELEVENNGEEIIEKKKKKKIKENNDLGNAKIGVREGSEVKKEVKQPLKMKKKKKKKQKKKKSKNLEIEKPLEVENGGFSLEIVAETSEENHDDKKKVYVGGMPYSSTEDDIWNYFDHCGPLTDIDCLKFPDTGKFRGIAIISFKTEEAAEKALALDGSDMEGLYLKIQPYKTTRTPKTTNFSPPVIEGYNRIYAGNLSWDIAEDDLRKLFSGCNISSIRFGEDKETGEFKGYAHVDFSDSNSLATALKLDQKVVCGRPVKISRAVPAKGTPRNPISASAPAVVKHEENKSGFKAEIPRGPRENVSEVMSVTILQENNSGVGAGKLKRRTCYECGEKGHISSACPKKQATEQIDPNAS